MKFKNIQELKINKFDLLVRIQKRVKSDLILPEGSYNSNNNTMEYLEVVKLGDDVDDLNAGDLIIELRDPNKSLRVFKVEGKLYSLISRHDVVMATIKDNVSFEDEEEEITN